MFPALFLTYALTLYVHKYYMRWIGARVVRDMRNELFDGLQAQSLKFYGKTDIGQLISSCTNDTTLIEHVVSSTASAVAIAPLQMLVAVIFVIKSAVENDMAGMIIGLGLVFPVCILPIIILGRFVKRHMQSALGKISHLVSRMHENFTGITLVKASHTERAEAIRFRDMNAGYFRSIMRVLRAELLPPFENGIIWSYCKFSLLPHIWHLPPSLYQTFCRTSGGICLG